MKARLLSVEVGNTVGLRGYVTALRDIQAETPYNLDVVAGTAATSLRTWMAKDINKNLGLALLQRDIKRLIRRKQIRNASYKVTLPHEYRPPLRDFKPRQIKVGTSYTLDKREGRQIAPGAFQGPKPGLMRVKWRGRVFKRTTKARLPIVQLHGASPLGVFAVSNNRVPAAKLYAAERLKYEANRRLRYLIIRKRGLI